ncbi:hypothetical protein HDA32_005193 [Spinactinospora alkalitolerans]|uniref:Uncharacterized protein n=1 Tax=Spinactinospora alkalitolerans TaxID=687207 RepID=A0A852U5A9_9ACTN|nr:hypothetical protein [Spinactinospora alkalitolerans]NYE50073.1 hypothetical protein [Spinactinospora alkalitolerans]
MAVRIRTHPKMRVTAPSKSKNAVRAAAFTAANWWRTGISHVRRPGKTRKWHAANATAVRALLAEANREGRADPDFAPGRALWRGVSLQPVLDFVDAYRFHPKTVDAARDLMLEYIRRRNKSGALVRWNIGVIGNKPVPDGGRVVLPDGAVRRRVRPPATSP